MLHINQNKVEIGDVLDEINENVINGESKGKLRKIMRKANGQPIMLHIIKVFITKMAINKNLYVDIL